MQAIRQTIPDIVLFEPKVFVDDRGAFFESFNAKIFEETTGFSYNFVQDNHSVSAKGVLRGLHYQLQPHAQGKLVRVVAGSVFDVVVDIRRSSPTFGKWVGATLSAQNRKQLWIPAGFAHAFVALEDDTEFLYKCTNYYSAAFERSIVWNDATIGIDWPITDAPRLSEKDLLASPLEEAEVFD